MIRQIAPLFFSLDIPATLAYFKDTLGFACVGTWQDPPVYAIVARDGQEPPRANPEKYEEELLDAYFVIEDVDGLYEEYAARGVEFERKIGDMPWQAREFVVKDCDGRLLAFGKPNDAASVLPAPVPEVPVADVDKAAAYYVEALGFTLDFGGEDGGLAGISRGICRLFLTNRAFREPHGNTGPLVFWLNLGSRAEVDELFGAWKAGNAKIVSEPEDKPWKLREFTAADLDGNRIRVFYDFRWEEAR
jgi:uncharacterized glyoxalase superfamily protein PhnB